MLRSVPIIDGERSTWSESRTADRLDGTGQGHTWGSGALGDCPGSASPGSTCVCPRPGPAGTVPAECQRPACRHCAVPRKTSWRLGGGPPGHGHGAGGQARGLSNNERLTYNSLVQSFIIPSRGGLLSALVFRVWTRVDTNRSFGLWPRVAASLLRGTTAIDQRRRLCYRLAACESLGRIRERCRFSTCAQDRVIPRVTDARIDTGLRTDRR